MDIIINDKHKSIFSKLSITLFVATALVACGGGGGGGGDDGVTDGTGDGVVDDVSDVSDVNNDTNTPVTSDDYLATAASVYISQASLGGIYAVQPAFAKLSLYYSESGQEVTACTISGEKQFDRQKSGPDRSVSAGDTMTVTYQQCDDGDGAQAGTMSINIVEHSEVSNIESRTLYDSIENKTMNGVSHIQNLRIKEEELGEADVSGINSDRYEADGSFKGNPNSADHPAPHYEDESYRFTRMIFEKYQNDSTNDTYLYWDIDVVDKGTSAFSYTTTVEDDIRINNSGLSSGSYSVIYQGDKIEVTIAGTENIQVTFDQNNDGTIDDQQQITDDEFFAAGFVVPQ
ncbi:MAG: hypothetical protein ABW092_20515 [Candidatus Thiodiazotropha sp.]